MKNYMILLLIIILLICLGCEKSSTEPNIEDECQSIQWGIISGKLAYSRITLEDGLTGFLFIADGNSRNVTLLKQSKSHLFANLVWKHDGSLLRFSDFDYTKDRYQLFNIRLDDKVMENIYSSDGHCNYPAWSRDGRLAYWYNGACPHMDEIRIDGNMFFNKAFATNLVLPVHRMAIT